MDKPRQTRLTAPRQRRGRNLAAELAWGGLLDRSSFEMRVDRRRRLDRAGGGRSGVRVLARDARLFGLGELAGPYRTRARLSRRAWRAAYFRRLDERRGARARLYPCQRAALSDGDPAP